MSFTSDKFQIRILCSLADGYKHTKRKWLQTKPFFTILKIPEYSSTQTRIIGQQCPYLSVVTYFAKDEMAFLSHPFLTWLTLKRKTAQTNSIAYPWDLCIFRHPKDISFSHFPHSPMIVTVKYIRLPALTGQLVFLRRTHSLSHYHSARRRRKIAFRSG